MRTGGLRIKDLKVQLQEINKDLLPLEDSAELEERRASLEQLLYNLKIELNRLVGAEKESPLPAKSEVKSMSGIQMPRNEKSTFNPLSAAVN